MHNVRQKFHLQSITAIHLVRDIQFLSFVEAKVAYLLQLRVQGMALLSHAGRIHFVFLCNTHLPIHGSKDVWVVETQGTVPNIVMLVAYLALEADRLRVGAVDRLESVRQDA